MYEPDDSVDLSELKLRNPTKRAVLCLEILLAKATDPDDDEGIDRIGSILERALCRYAAQHKEETITVYDHVGTSFSFGVLGQSRYLAAIPSKKLITFVTNSLKSHKVHCRIGEYVTLNDEWMLRYHLEDGRAWQVVDIITAEPLTCTSDQDTVA
jgi:hypothetical protein